MYESNVKDLPTLRRQFPDWTVDDYMRRVREAHIKFPEPFDEDGLYIKSDFLEPPKRDRIIQNFKVYGGTLSKELITMYHDFGVMEKIADYIKECTNLSNLENQMSMNTFYQKVINSPQDNDVQKVFHMDTFFPAWKFWYFPQGSRGINTGNFMYVRGSHVFDETKQAFMRDRYQKFLDGEDMDKDSLEGSFRISDEEIQEHYPDGRCEVVIPSNTLVLANVFGFHCRGNTNEETERLAIHGSIRFSDPFKNRRIS